MNAKFLELTKIPFWVWIAVYILEITIFAFIFSLKPQDFSYGTIKLEGGFEYEVQNLSLEINKKVTPSFIKRNQAAFPDYYEGLNKVIISDLIIKNQIILFRLNSIRKTDYKKSTIYQEESIKMELDTDDCEVNGLNRIKKLLGEEIEISEDESHDCPVKFDYLGVSTYSSPRKVEELNTKYLPDDVNGLDVGLPNPCVVNPKIKGCDEYIPKIKFNFASLEYENMLRIVRVANGFPDKIEGLFFRMLYFSLITITTVGYGDISPISDLSRSLVALEVILGSITFGVFLWSLGVNFSKNQSN